MLSFVFIEADSKILPKISVEKFPRYTLFVRKRAFMGYLGALALDNLGSSINAKIL